MSVTQCHPTGALMLAPCHNRAHSSQITTSTFHPSPNNAPSTFHRPCAKSQLRAGSRESQLRVGREVRLDSAQGLLPMKKFPWTWFSSIFIFSNFVQIARLFVWFCVFICNLQLSILIWTWKLMRGGLLTEQTLTVRHEKYKMREIESMENVWKSFSKFFCIWNLPSAQELTLLSQLRDRWRRKSQCFGWVAMSKKNFGWVEKSFWADWEILQFKILLAAQTCAVTMDGWHAEQQQTMHCVPKVQLCTALQYKNAL